MTSYPVGRSWAAAPAGARFKSAPLTSGILLATGSETWSDWQGAGAPVVYLNS